MKPRIKKAPLQHERKPREGMSPKHLELVRQLPCLGCGGNGSPALVNLPWGAAVKGGIHAHHLLRTEERGLNRKSSDRWAVPLCFFCHDPRVNDSVHDDGDEDAWFAAKGIDARSVARELWKHSGDFEAMRRTIDRARQQARLVSP